MIEDSRETVIRFLRSLPPEERVELQAISVLPFFDDEIEQAIKRFDPDLIILDLHLAREIDSGFRVLRRLKDSVLLQDVPVVVCSKFISKDPNDKSKQRAMDHGATVVLPKTPFPAAQDFLNCARKRKQEG